MAAARSSRPPAKCVSMCLDALRRNGQIAHSVQDVRRRRASAAQTRRLTCAFPPAWQMAARTRAGQRKCRTMAAPVAICISRLSKAACVLERRGNDLYTKIPVTVSKRRSVQRLKCRRLMDGRSCAFRRERIVARPALEEKACERAEWRNEATNMWKFRSWCRRDGRARPQSDEGTGIGSAGRSTQGLFGKAGV